MKKENSIVEKKKSVNYLKAVRDFERSQGRKSERTDFPVRYSITPDGGVDYQAIMKKYEQHQLIDDSEVICNKNNAEK